MPRLTTTVVLMLSVTCSLAWGKPPADPQKSNRAVPPSAQQAEQQDNETFSGVLPSTKRMEANLASTFFSGLWTNSMYEGFLPQFNTQPVTGARSGKQLTRAGKLKGHSQPKPGGKNQLTKSGKLGIPLTDHDSEPESDDTPGPSDFMQPPLFGSGKMRAFHQGLDFCQQSPGKRMDIMKGNLAGQLTTPLPQYKCQFCPKTHKTKKGHTNHEKKCPKRPLSAQSEPVPPSPDNAARDEELVLEKEPPLTLAECSRLVSAYIEHPEWQDFLESGRHATTQTTTVKTGWNALTLDTVSPADQETPFPDLTPAALSTLAQLSPTIDRLYQQLQAGKDPLAERSALTEFLKEAAPNKGELFAGGNHSLVIKWRNGPGYVLKIARSKQDSFRLKREQNLYLWLRHPDNVLLNLTTTPMRAAFSVHDKQVLALRQVDGTARDRLRLMKKYSLNERLDFALSVIMHFCQMYRRFLKKDVLLADRHEDNIGFNEIPLPGRKTMGLDDAIIQVPVMLDLDPYWFGDQETREIKLHLPAWLPVVVGLLEEVFIPVNSDSQISESRVKVIDKIRQFASPVFSSSSPSALPAAEGVDIESALQSCINHWFQSTDPEYSELLAEARSHIELLLARLNRWDSTPRTVAEWNKRLQENIGEILQWLNNWKNETRFSLLEDFTDEGIIRVSSAQGGTSPRDQQILTLLSMIHGKLGCQKCSRTFTTNKEFRRHLELHQRKKLEHCEICGGDFTHIPEHKRIHTREKPYECKHCGKCFSVSGSLTKHLRTHTGDKRYKCEHCAKSFSESARLNRHLRIHSGDKPYKCERCGKCFSLAMTLKNHLRTHSGDKPYECEHCGKRFSLANILKNHLRTHSGDKPYECEYCGKCFSLANILKNHLRTHSGDKPYRCMHCGKCFSQNGNLQKHLLNHTGDKPYKCELCGKAFSQNGHLKSHLRTHSGDKPYRCKHCGKCFPRSNSLKNHLRTHSGDKPYECMYCSRCFSENSNLQRHLRTHTDDKPYKCELCGKAFSQNGNLKSHLRTHSGDKPYQCKHCSKCFPRSNNLKEHLRTHSGDKPYKCEHCSKCFSLSGNLKKHLRTHSNDES